jgi:4-alpha-glucanotransferase
VIPERLAGVLIPLSSIRTDDDFGRGDIGGLRPFGEFALAMGKRLIQLLPIDETLACEASPYSAMSVLAIDPSFISISGLVGIDAATRAAARAEALKAPFSLLRLRAIKDRLLDDAFRYFKLQPPVEQQRAFAGFLESNQGWLDDYALFRALKEKFGGIEWTRWPTELSRHEPRAIAQAASAMADRIEGFKFVQFVAAQQWRSARAKLSGRGVFLGGDLAFLPGRESVEVWANQELFDLTRAVGAPPDAFSEAGQRWGLPMPRWSAMRASDYDFIRLRVRNARELFDVLRIDHVVGLFRTYGYPADDEKAAGAFDPLSEEAQRAHGEAILRVIIEEAEPMQITAEDLGVIPAFVRETLARLDLPGYKIARWERDWSSPQQLFRSPASYPRMSLATTGTHDTDTLAEWWEAIEEQERRSFMRGLGIAGERLPSRLDDRLRERIIEGIYASPSRLAICPIQDLFGWKDRINVPGTVSERNWSWRMPFATSAAIDDGRLRDEITRLCAIAEHTGRFRP